MRQYQPLHLAVVHHHHPHHLLLNLLFLSLMSQGQKRCRPAVQLGLSELPKENHSAPFFLLYFLALSSFRGDAHAAVICLSQASLQILGPNYDVSPCFTTPHFPLHYHFF